MSELLSEIHTVDFLLHFTPLNLIFVVSRKYIKLKSHEHGDAMQYYKKSPYHLSITVQSHCWHIFYDKLSGT